MMKKPNIVVIGAGTIGEVHIATVDMLENCTLYGVCDNNAALAKEVAGQYGAKAFTSVDALCADAAVDGAIVCVPDELHLAVCRQLAAAKKNIWVEKPIAYTYEESVELARIAEESGIVFGVAQSTEYLLSHQIARDEVKSGALGEPVHLCFRHVADWGCGRETSPRAKLMYYLGVHDVYSIQNITGLKITRVFSRTVSKILKDIGGQDAILTVFTLENGAIGTLEIGWDTSPATGHDLMEFTICGTEGTIISNLPTINLGYRSIGAEGPGPNDITMMYSANGLYGGGMPEEDRDFAACVADPTRKIAASTEWAVYSVKVIEAIHRSLESGVEETV